MAVAWTMAAAFLTFTIVDLATSPFGWTDNAYTSLFDGIIGLHATHVTVGLAMSAAVQAKQAVGRVGPDRFLTVRLAAMYWHFVDAVWVVVFACLYLSVSLR
jgi:heme/copper-type cytochrome/quinol oxidase subunit 3